MEFIDRRSIVFRGGSQALSSGKYLVKSAARRFATRCVSRIGVEVTSPKGVIIASSARPSAPTHQLLLRRAEVDDIGVISGPLSWIFIY